MNYPHLRHHQGFTLTSGSDPSHENLAHPIYPISRPLFHVRRRLDRATHRPDQSSVFRATSTRIRGHALARHHRRNFEYQEPVSIINARLTRQPV